MIVSSDIALKASLAIDQSREALATAITDRHFELHPELSERYGDIGRTRCLEDAHFHLSYLSEAIRASLPSLFGDYIAWAKVMLESRNVPAADLAENLKVIRDVLRDHLAENESAVTDEYLDWGVARLPDVPELPSPLRENAPLSKLARQYLDSLLAGERNKASRLVLEAVKEGARVSEIYLHVFQPSQHEIGRLWQLNRISVAQEHYCTAATQLVMSQLYPYIFTGERKNKTLVATCVAGDLHEIGVRMVADFFEMDGWDTFYLGANVPTRSVIQTLIDRRADVLAASATITSHVGMLADLIRAVRNTPECRDVKIIVGGYPFKVAPDLWRQVGADGFGRDAAESIAVANQLIEDKN